MISYYKYWQAMNTYEESLKTVMALQPDVPPMIEAQNEMDQMVMLYWRKKSEKFTKYFLLFIVVLVIMVSVYVKGFLHV